MTAFKFLRVLILVAVAGLMGIGRLDVPLLAAPHSQKVRVEITSPEANAVVSGRVSIRGSASIPNFQFYKVEYGMGTAPGQWVIVNTTHTTPVEDGLLDTWETTLVPDGSYTLLLTVVDLTGNYQQYRIENVVVANVEPVPSTPTVPMTRTESPTPTETPPIVMVPPTATPVIVEQPDVGEEEEPPISDLQPIVPPPEAANPLEQLARGLGLDVCGQAFCIGGGIIGFSVAIIVGVGLLRWLIRVATRTRSSEEP